MKMRERVNKHSINRCRGFIAGILLSINCCFVGGCTQTSVNQNDSGNKAVEVSDPLIEFLVDQIRPPDEVLTGTVNRIVVEDYVDMFNKSIVAEFDGNSEFSAIIVTAMREGHAFFAKYDRKYALHIYIDEKQQPLYVSVKNERFHIKGEGQYTASINLEQLMTKLITQSEVEFPPNTPSD